MPRFVSERTDIVRNNPSEGSSIQLVVRVDSDSIQAATEWVVAHDGDRIDGLDHGLLAIELPEVHVSAICELPYVSSVEHPTEAISLFGLRD